jgi:hypothetical protein
MQLNVGRQAVDQLAATGELTRTGKRFIRNPQRAQLSQRRDST